jgi:hypothetical protein
MEQQGASPYYGLSQLAQGLKQLVNRILDTESVILDPKLSKVIIPLKHLVTAVTTKPNAGAVCNARQHSTDLDTAARALELGMQSGVTKLLTTTGPLGFPSRGSISS